MLAVEFTGPRTVEGPRLSGATWLRDRFPPHELIVPLGSTSTELGPLGGISAGLLPSVRGGKAVITAAGAKWRACLKVSHVGELEHLIFPE